MRLSQLWPLAPLFTIALCIGCGEVTETQVAADQAEEEAADIVAQQALAGVGKQGQKLRDDEGLGKIISGPALALIDVKQKAVLEWQIPQALGAFRALEGRFPKSHEEFMEKIVQANNLKLPELPAGAVYQFNTEKGELWVYPEDELPQ